MENDVTQHTFIYNEFKIHEDIMFNLKKKISILFQICMFKVF